MSVEESKPTDPAPSRAPRAGLQIMALILGVMTVLALYSNYQDARRDQLESVSIAPAPPLAPTPTPVPDLSDQP